MAMAAFFGLFSVFFLPDVKTVLLFSNHSETNDEALKRYIATGTHLLIWYHECYKKDTTDFNAFMKSMTGVRDMHRNVSVNATTHGAPLYSTGAFDYLPINEQFWEAVAADLEACDIPTSQRSYPASYTQYDSTAKFVNQFALGMTQFSFIGYPIIRSSEAFLYNLSDEERKGLVHLWALFGYGLGIEDAYNICLQNNIASVNAYFNDIHDKYYIPGLFNMDRDSKVLVEAVLGVRF